MSSVLKRIFLIVIIVYSAVRLYQDFEAKKAWEHQKLLINGNNPTDSRTFDFELEHRNRERFSSRVARSFISLVPSDEQFKNMNEAPNCNPKHLDCLLSKEHQAMQTISLLYITQDGIYGQKDATKEYEKLVTLQEGKLDNNDKKGDKIIPLFDFFTQKRKRILDLKFSSQENQEFSGEILIAIDPNIKYSLLRDIMSTALSAKYVRFFFMNELISCVDGFNPNIKYPWEIRVAKKCNKSNSFRGTHGGPVVEILEDDVILGWSSVLATEEANSSKDLLLEEIPLKPHIVIDKNGLTFDYLSTQFYFDGSINHSLNIPCTGPDNNCFYPCSNEDKQSKSDCSNYDYKKQAEALVKIKRKAILSGLFDETSQKLTLVPEKNTPYMVINHVVDSAIGSVDEHELFSGYAERDNRYKGLFHVFSFASNLPTALSKSDIDGYVVLLETKNKKNDSSTSKIKTKSSYPILGTWSKSHINSVIIKNLEKIRYCYQNQLAKEPNIGGKITVKFVVSQDGSVTSASIKETTMNSSKVETCIRNRFMEFVFPKTESGITIVQYPFLFSSR